MRYLPCAPGDERAMLERIGAKSIDDLFESIPQEIRFTGKLDLPAGLAEQELQAYFCELAAGNRAAMFTSFAGAGHYRHFIPSHIDQLISRSEFYTAYTPYQAELSQGTLQTIFEWQTLICMLTGLEVANASLYDGAGACSEALLMADRIGRRRKRVIIAESLHPHYREVCDTYLSHLDLDIQSAPIGDDGRVALPRLASMIDERTSGVLVQSPNFLGVIEDVETLARPVREAGALLMVAVGEPLSLGILRPPGRLGADVVCGEGQSFGIPPSYGGPGLGFFSTREAHVRQMPGRLVGRAKDIEGRDGFIMALATREQHIRREKATSNICTNQGLCMTMATIYLQTMGRAGLRELAVRNLQKAAYLKQRLTALPRVSAPYSAPVFNEFVVRLPQRAAEAMKALEEEGIIAGIDLGRFRGEWANDLLVCATELITRAAIDRFASALGDAL